MKRKNIIMALFVIFLVLWTIPVNSPYQFQLVPTNEVPLGPVSFSSPAADTYQYVDARQSILYGTTVADPPAGMGADSVVTTNMTEASFSDTSYVQLEYAAFSSTPTGWTLSGFSVTGGVVRSTSDGAVMATKAYDLSTYTGIKLTYVHRPYDFLTPYFYEAGDWAIGQVTDFTPVTIAWIADVPSNRDAGGAWYSAEATKTSTSSSFYLAIYDKDADATEQIETDNWYIYGIASTTCYRFEAVFRFDSVTQALASYALYVDFYPALSGSDDLDFYIGTTTNPTNLVGNDKQDDFNVVVTDYITDSPIYLKVMDDYRSGDTVQTTAYISRCYLYTPSESVGWYDNDWDYRKQISVVEQAGAGTNYQIPIIGYYNDSTKDVAGSVDFEALCQSDFDDIRFTASNGTTLLDYWIDNEGYSAGTSAKFWVEVKADVSTTSSDVKIFVYFGNIEATSVSNGDNTFIFFDSFEDNDLTEWTAEALWKIGSTTVKYGTYAAWGDAGTTGRSIYKTQTFDYDFMIHTWVRYVADPTFVFYHIVGAPSGACYSVSVSATPFNLQWYQGTYTNWPSNSGTTVNAWHKIEVGYSFTDSTQRGWNDGTSMGSIDFENDAGTDITSISAIRSMCSGTTNEDMFLDDYYVRNWQVTEPTFAAPENLEYQDLYAPVIQAVSYSPINPTTATGLTLFAIVTDADAVAMHSVSFNPLAYPTGFNASASMDATEVGTNTWSYTIAAEDLVTGVYCFITSAQDTAHSDIADYTQYHTIYVTEAVEDQITCYIVVFDNLGNFIPFETFEVYRNNERQYNYQFQCYDYEPQNITIQDRWGEVLNSTEFDVGTIELVVLVQTYSLKFMSWYNGFAEVNITHGGVTYGEIIMPMEVIEFMLYNGTYTYEIDYLNGTTSGSYNIDMVNSTGVVITGDTITDIMSMSSQLWTLVTAVNVTITATNNYVLTIQVDLDNVNTTINNQLIQVLLDIDNTNTTVFNQVVNLLAELQNINTTLYDQTVTLIADISNLDSDIAAQTVTLLASIGNVNSTIYSQTVTLIADIANLDSDIVAQTVTLLASIENMNSTLYSQTVLLISQLTNVNTTVFEQTITMLANIATLYSTTVTQTLNILLNITSVNSTIYTQTVNILSAISNMNSTIYDQTVEMLADIQNVNSTLYSQTITLLANIANLDSDIVAQTVTLLASIANLDSDIVAQTVTLLASIENVNTTIYSQTIDILSDISNVNSTLYAQAIDILSDISNVNSTVYAQTISILAYVLDTNTAVNLVLNPDTFYIIFADFSFSDAFTHFYGMSSWHNATVTIYENDVQMVAPFSELVVPVLYALSTTPGTYNVSAKFVSGANTAWYNTSYTIAEVVAFKVEEWQLYLHLGVESFVEGYVLTTWQNATIYVYDNGTLMVTVLEGEGGTSFYWWMAEQQGTHNIVLNITNGVTTVTKTRSYFIPDWAVSGLVGRFDIWNMQNNYTSMSLESNWGNCTVYIYLDSVLVATSGDDPASVSFQRSANIGIFNLTIVWDGGAQNYTRKNVYFTITEEGTTYISGGFSEVNYNYEGDTTTYEEDPEKFVTLVIAVTSLVFLSIFIGGIVMWWEKRKEKRQDFRAAVSGGQ